MESLPTGVLAVILLAGAAGCVAGALWLAQLLALPERLARESSRQPAAQRRNTLLRSGLGLVAIGITISLMTGLVPGASFVHPWTLLACVGCGLLGMLIIVSAQREPIATGAHLTDHQAIAGRIGQPRTESEVRTAA